MTKTSADTPVMRQYLSAKAEYPDAVLFFRMGDFYEMFFEDAVTVSAVLDLALTSRDKGKENPIPMAGFPHHALQGYLGRMVEAGYKVAICEQMEDPRKVKGIVKREVTRVVTAGVILDDEQLDAKVSNYLMAVATHGAGDGAQLEDFGSVAKAGEGTGARNVVREENGAEVRGRNGAGLGERSGKGGGAELASGMGSKGAATQERLGIAFLDASTGEFLAAELPGGEGLGDELARVRPRQILIPPGELEAMGRRWPELGAHRPEVAPEGIFGRSTEDQELLASAAQVDAEWLDQAPAARRACAAVIRYVRGLLPGTDLPPFRVVPYTPSAYLVLDEATLANLEIFETLMERRRQGSLLGVLDQTVTSMGARLLRRSLAFPLASPQEIWKRQEAVAFLLDHARLREALRRALKDLHDLERLNRRVVSGLATPRDLGLLRSSLQAAPEVIALVTDVAQGQTLEELPELLQPPEDVLEDLAARLGRVLVDEPPLSMREGGIVRRGHSPELDKLVSLAEGGKEQILAMEARERERTGIGSLRIRYNKVFGYTIEVSRAKAAAVPEDYVRKQTLANVERFVTPELSEHETMVLTAEEKRVELEERIFLRLRGDVAQAEARVGRLAAGLATLDLLCTFAEVSARNDYCRPKVNDGDLIRIHQGRHPVVEEILGRGRFVPNDLTLSSSEAQVVIVTGPNMAGKSTIIRQVALVTLLAHTGCFVPARDATVGVVDRIFTRVGASDNLARGQSTFMVEMRESANILSNATSRSLVVLDEIGRGTSTYDGVSIAWAVAEYLHDRIRAKTLFATHFHELCRLEDVKPRVRNSSVAVREIQGDVVFLHKLVKGGASRSHGIQVARLAGLPHEVVDRARQILAHLERGADGETPGGGGLPLLAPQLSLFGDVARARSEANRPTDDPASAASSGAVEEILERLRQVDPDSLSPREAQELLYEIVAMLPGP